MKNYEVGVIVAAIVIIGYLWWKNGSTQTKNPVNAVSKGYSPDFMGPLPPGGYYWTPCNTA